MDSDEKKKLNFDDFSAEEGLSFSERIYFILTRDHSPLEKLAVSLICVVLNGLVVYSLNQSALQRM